MEPSDLIELILRGRESRRVEMKASLDFSRKTVKAKLAKAAMGMANTRDGGIVILGMKELGEGQFEPQGMDPGHLLTFDQDRVSSSVMEYAAPYVELAVRRVVGDNHPSLGDKVFVVLDVLEFAEMPVICKRSYQNEGVREGAVYVRSFERYETREVQTEGEMRELLDLAIEKRLRRHLQLTESAGGVIVPHAEPEKADAKLFESQAEAGGLPL
jgi:hypothetical protein